MKKIRSVLAVVLALSLSLSIAACGGGSEGESTTAPPQTQGEATSPSSAPTSDNSDNTTEPPALTAPADADESRAPPPASTNIGFRQYEVLNAATDRGLISLQAAVRWDANDPSKPGQVHIAEKVEGVPEYIPIDGTQALMTNVAWTSPDDFFISVLCDIDIGDDGIARGGRVGADVTVAGGEMTIVRLGHTYELTPV
jgi:hypothetical protein